jgi:hypothetical protein
MEDHLQTLFFDEVQRFPLWIRAIVLLVVVALGCPAILMWSFMEADLGLVRMLFAALTLVALVGAALTFRTELVTKLDSSNLHLRIYPLKWSLLPRRMTQTDIALSDICRWEVRSYNSLLSSEYWGWHYWGLGVAKGGRYLYMMRPSSPISGRGVQLRLSSGERVLVGSERPEELENAITTAKSASR